MKKTIVLLVLVLMVSATGTMAQRKKKQAAAADSSSAKTVVTDTSMVTTVQPKVGNDSLKSSKNYDSLTSQLVLYKNFYTLSVINFSPKNTRTSKLEKPLVLQTH